MIVCFIEKSSSSSDKNETEVEEIEPKKEIPVQSPPAVFGAIITKSRTQKPEEISLASGFVFGQNLHERVELNKEADSTSEDDKKPNDTQESEVSSSSNTVSPSFGNLKNEEPDEVYIYLLMHCVCIFNSFLFYLEWQT